jgi:hypoxanthine-guanine phosphoribosyltransferase
MMQDYNRVQMSVSGFSSHYEFVLGAGIKAKTVTNNLPLLSVLCGRSNIIIVIYIV